MEPFAYREGVLYCEDVSLPAVVESHGSPLYIYSKRGFVDRFRRIKEAFSEVGPLLCYSVKACSHLSILSLLKEEGAAFDIVSGGELFRVRKIGVSPDRIVFAGVGKTEKEIRYGLEEGILMFNVESLAEARKINQIAGELSKKAPIALRLNPDVDPRTHKKITTGKKENKFGIHLKDAETFLREELPKLQNIQLLGIHFHIGSQIQSAGPYRETLEQGLAFLKNQKDHLPSSLQYLNIGGGYGIDYQKVSELDISAFASELVPRLKDSGLKILMEPGRFISANSAVLLTGVTYKKEGVGKTFLICDTGMHHLIRPTLYESFHQIWPVKASFTFAEGSSHQEELAVVDIVGPICESGDFLGLERSLPADVQQGDTLAVFSAGAYGAAMASRYNSHPRPVEILVDGKEFKVITPPQKWEELVDGEVY